MSETVFETQAAFVTHEPGGEEAFPLEYKSLGDLRRNTDLHVFLIMKDMKEKKEMITLIVNYETALHVLLLYSTP